MFSAHYWDSCDGVLLVSKGFSSSGPDGLWRNAEKGVCVCRGQRLLLLLQVLLLFSSSFNVLYLLHSV